MDKLFELSAELTLDAAAFLRGLAQAEKAIQAVAASMQALQTTARTSWNTVAQAIQAATDKLQSYVSLQGRASTAVSAAASLGAGTVRSTQTHTAAPVSASSSSAAGTNQASSQGQSAPAAPAVSGYATGIEYVPYDGFPALLHQGEAVLTALEARHWREEPSAPHQAAIQVDALAQAVAAVLSGTAVQLDGETVGQLVTPTVSREIARQAGTTFA